MSRIQNVLDHYMNDEGSPPGKRQLNAVLPLEDFAKLEALCAVYKTTKRSLGSDLLAAAVRDAFDLACQTPLDDSLHAAFDHSKDLLEEMDNT